MTVYADFDSALSFNILGLLLLRTAETLVFQGHPLLTRPLRLSDHLILLLVALRVNGRRFVSLHLKLDRVARLHLRLSFLLAGDFVRGGSVGLDVVNGPLPNFIFLLLIGGVLP